MPRRPHRARAALLAGGLAIALALGACDGGGSETPVPGGELRVSVRDLGSLDPATTTGRGALLVIAQVFDSLTSVDARTGRPVSAAASEWSASTDGLTWTFTLTAATFHDGTPVTAGDFKAAFDRLARKATNSDAAFQLEAVKGFSAAKIQGTAESLEGVQVVDDKTLRIVLERPFAELPVFLAHPALAPLPKTLAANPAAIAAQPIGNGPFKMAAPRAADVVTLERFDGHAGGTALLDRVSIRLVSDADQAWRDFLGGRTEVAEVPTQAIPGSTGRVGSGGFGPFWAALYYGPNIRNPKYARAEVRKAISLAIDRGAIAETVYGGTKEPGTGLVPRGVRGFEARACGDCAQDADRARSLLAAVFGTALPEMIVDHLDASPSREVAQAIAGNLQSVGLRVALRAHSSTDYLRLLQSGGQEIAELGWLAEVPSPDGFLAQQLRSGSPNNHTGFADPAFDALIDTARGTAEESARIDAYRKAETSALEAMALVPIVFFRNHVGVAGRVRSLRIDGAGLFDASRVWIARG